MAALLLLTSCLLRADKADAVGGLSLALTCARQALDIAARHDRRRYDQANEFCTRLEARIAELRRAELTQGGRPALPAGAAQTPKDTARDFLRTSYLARRRGDASLARSLQLASLEIYEAQGDAAGMAAALCGLGMAEVRLGRLAEARSHFARSLALYRELGDEYGQADALHGVGWAYAEGGEAEDPEGREARNYYEQSLAISERIGYKWRVAQTYNNVANCHTVGYAPGKRFDLGLAARLLARCLALRRELGDGYGAALALTSAAHLAQAQAREAQANGDARRARRKWEMVAEMYGAAEEIEREHGVALSRLDESTRRIYSDETGAARGALGDKVFSAAWERGRTLAPAEILLRIEA